MNTKEIREALNKLEFVTNQTKVHIEPESINWLIAETRALCDAADENKRLRKDLGAALVSGMQGDTHAIKEIADGYKIEFPDGDPVANPPEADDE